MYQVVRLSDRPALESSMFDVIDEAWPKYVFETSVVPLEQQVALCQHYPQYQFALVECESDTVQAVACSTPVVEASALQSGGWDGVMNLMSAESARALDADALCLLSISVRENARSLGLPEKMIAAIKEAVSFARIIGPIAPVKKTLFPEMDIDEYVAKRTEDGRDETYDPWIRLHERLGASVIGVCRESMKFAGNREQLSKFGSESPPRIHKSTSVPEVAPDGTWKLVEANVWMGYTIQKK